VRLPRREAASGGGQRIQKKSLVLLTKLWGARDSELPWRIVEIYLTRWKIERIYRFLKQGYQLQDFRVLSAQRLRNLVVLGTVTHFAATLLE
jgi:transposase